MWASGEGERVTRTISEEERLDRRLQRLRWRLQNSRSNPATNFASLHSPIDKENVLNGTFDSLAIKGTKEPKESVHTKSAIRSRRHEGSSGRRVGQRVAFSETLEATRFFSETTSPGSPEVPLRFQDETSPPTFGLRRGDLVAPQGNVSSTPAHIRAASSSMHMECVGINCATSHIEEDAGGAADVLHQHNNVQQQQYATASKQHEQQKATCQHPGQKRAWESLLPTSPTRPGTPTQPIASGGPKWRMPTPTLSPTTAPPNVNAPSASRMVSRNTGGSAGAQEAARPDSHSGMRHSVHYTNAHTRSSSVSPGPLAAGRVGGFGEDRTGSRSVQGRRWRGAATGAGLGVEGNSLVVHGSLDLKSDDVRRWLDSNNDTPLSHFDSMHRCTHSLVLSLGAVDKANQHTNFSRGHRPTTR